jgi:hypothetical protein
LCTNHQHISIPNKHPCIFGTCNLAHHRNQKDSSTHISFQKDTKFILHKCLRHKPSIHLKYSDISYSSYYIELLSRFLWIVRHQSQNLKQSLFQS